MIIGFEGAKCYHPSILCPMGYAYWRYQPSFSINLAFTVLFGLSMVAFLVQGIAGKRWLGFTIAMASGCALEVIGYVGRLMAHDDMFSEVCVGNNIACLVASKLTPCRTPSSSKSSA